MTDGGSRLYLVGGTSLKDASEADLVAAFVRGDHRAPAALWDRYYGLVRRVLARAIGPHQDVEDLVQEVFLRLYRKIATLRDPNSLKSFVLVITTRVIQTELRVRWFRRWLGLFDDGQMPEQATDDTDLDAREALAHFYKILDGMNAKHRSAFVLRFVEGLELAEVAQTLGVSLATIKRWLPRISHRVFSEAQRDPLLARYIQHDGGVEAMGGCAP